MTVPDSAPVLPEGFRPGCPNWRCVCWIPGAVCPEFMGYDQDQHCPRCGWDRDHHQATS